MSDRPAVRLAVPWLHDAICAASEAGTRPPMDAFDWLAARAESRPAPAGDWREWLLAAVDPALAGAPERWPAGPSLAAACGLRVGAGQSWAVAQPVHLAAGMDHLRMAPLAQSAPDDDETQQIAASLRAHFSVEELELVDFVGGAWLVRFSALPDCATHDPAAVAGRDVHDFMPAGDGGARVRRLMNEIQMLLHEHPVNVRRIGSGALPINGMWLWGFGEQVAQAAATPSRLPAWTLQADDPWIEALWRVHGGATAPPDAPLDMSAGADHLVVRTRPASGPSEEALAEVDANLLGPVRQATGRGALRRLEIHDGAHVHTLDAWARWRFWRRRPAMGGARTDGRFPR